MTALEKQSTSIQLFRESEVLKANVQDVSLGHSEAWTLRERLQEVYQSLLLMDLEYALDKKIEQELWNFAFKNQINTMQQQIRDRKNPKRGEVQASLSLFLEAASGSYSQLLVQICTHFQLDIPGFAMSHHFGITSKSSHRRDLVNPSSSSSSEEEEEEEEGGERRVVRRAKPSSCLYMCQYSLVHLGDIARYQSRNKLANLYYNHAAKVVPCNGQPYNQLAILSAASGDYLSTVYFYCRAILVKHNFPAATTNLNTTFSKLMNLPHLREKFLLTSLKELSKYFLRLHGILYLSDDIDEARDLAVILVGQLKVFMSRGDIRDILLVRLVAINLFTLNNCMPPSSTTTTTAAAATLMGKCAPPGGGVMLVSEDETACWFLAVKFSTDVTLLLMSLVLGQGQVDQLSGLLAAIKVFIDWLLVDSHLCDPTLSEHMVRLWPRFAAILNFIQTTTLDNTDFVSTNSDSPLWEDDDMFGYQPLERVHDTLEFNSVKKTVILEGAESDIQRVLRLVTLGKTVADTWPACLNYTSENTSSNCIIHFSSPIPEQADPDTAPLTPAHDPCSTTPPSVDIIAPSSGGKRNRGVAVQARVTVSCRPSVDPSTLSPPDSGLISASKSVSFSEIDSVISLSPEPNAGDNEGYMGGVIGHSEYQRHGIAPTTAAIPTLTPQQQQQQTRQPLIYQPRFIPGLMPTFHPGMAMRFPLIEQPPSGVKNYPPTGLPDRFIGPGPTAAPPGGGGGQMVNRCTPNRGPPHPPPQAGGSIPPPNFQQQFQFRVPGMRMRPPAPSGGNMMNPLVTDSNKPDHNMTGYLDNNAAGGGGGMGFVARGTGMIDGGMKFAVPQRYPPPMFHSIGESYRGVPEHGVSTGVHKAQVGYPSREDQVTPRGPPHPGNPSYPGGAQQPSHLSAEQKAITPPKLSPNNQSVTSSGTRLAINLPGLRQSADPTIGPSGVSDFPLGGCGVYPQQQPHSNAAEFAKELYERSSRKLGDAGYHDYNPLYQGGMRGYPTPSPRDSQGLGGASRRHSVKNELHLFHDSLAPKPFNQSDAPYHNYFNDPASALTNELDDLRRPMSLMANEHDDNNSTNQESQLFPTSQSDSLGSYSLFGNSPLGWSGAGTNPPNANIWASPSLGGPSPLELLLQQQKQKGGPNDDP